MQLMRYDAARSALEACVAVDEVMDWANTAAAYEAYARQSKDNELRKMALDIRMRAKRRLGEMMESQRATHGMNKGGRPSKTRVTPKPGLPTLAEAGIDKRLAHEARSAAALSPTAFEAAIEARKNSIDHPDFGPIKPVDVADTESAVMAEVMEHAAEAMTIIASDDQLKAAMAEIIKAKRTAKTLSTLYDALKSEVSMYKKEASRWQRKAKKSALCIACRVNLERDDE